MKKGCFGAMLALAGYVFSASGGLILHYAFDGDLTDSSLSDNHAIAAGTTPVTSALGKPVIGSGAAVFDGSGAAAVNLTTPVAFTNGQTFSIAFWAKDTGTKPGNGIVMGDVNNIQNFVYIMNNDQGIRFRASGKSVDFLNLTIDQQIHHYALTVEPSGTKSKVSFYMDGAFREAKTCESGALSITSVGSGYSGNSYAFNGTLDDVRLYDGLITPAEIAQLYDMRGGPLARYDFEGDFTDASGNANHGTAVGTGLVFTDDLDMRRVGTNALAFNGNAHVTLPTPISFANGEQWSAAFWASRTGNKDQGMIMGDSSHNGFIWVTENFQGFRFRNIPGRPDVDFTISKDARMHHYVLTANGDSQMCLFVDGAFSQMLPAADTSFLISHIGHAYDNSAFRLKGVLDDVRIYPYALNASDASRLFLQGRQALLHINFDDGDARDLSASGNHGTLGGAAEITVDPADVASAPAALVLDGAKASRITLARAIVFANGEPWTAAFWARRDGNNNQGMVLGASGNDNDFIWVTGSNNGFRFRPSTGGSLDFNGVKDHLMHHYALTANGDGTMSFYLDGVFRETRTFADTSFKISHLGYAYENNGHNLQGVLDDVRVYNYALDGASVSTLFAGGGRQRFHFDFEGGLQDRSPYGVTATANGTASVSIGDSSPLGLGALALDGSGYLTLAPALSLANNRAWTATFWANKTGDKDQGMIMGDRSNSTDFLWLTGNTNDKGFRFRPHSGGSNTCDFTASKETGLCHYALVSQGDGTLQFYIDGELTATDSTLDTSITINTIGRAYNDSKFNFKGVLDDVRVFDYALAPTNIAFLCGPQPLVTRIRVFLQGGQSNSEGRADPAQLPDELRMAQRDVDFYYYADGTLTRLLPATSSGTQFGPEITFGRHLSDTLCHDASNRVAIIKYSVGGSNLHTQWKAGGDATTTGDGPYYVNWQNTVTAGLAALATKYPYAEITVDGMIWMQGESDTDTAAYGDAYDANLTALIKDIRLTLALPRLPFVIGRLSSGQTNISGKPGYAAVRAAQKAVAARDRWVGMIDTDNCSLKSDALHFDGPGQMAMGYAFAAAVRALPDGGTIISLH